MPRRLSPHFTLEEFLRSDVAAALHIDNSPPVELVVRMGELCLSVLEPVRTHFARPVRLSSGYRCDELNRAVGGVDDGRHETGEAGDIEVDGVPNIVVARWIFDAKLPYDELLLEHYVAGVPHAGWVHVSHRMASRGGNRGVVGCISRSGHFTPGLP